MLFERQCFAPQDNVFVWIIFCQFLDHLSRVSVREKQAFLVWIVIVLEDKTEVHFPLCTRKH